LRIEDKYYHATTNTDSAPLDIHTRGEGVSCITGYPLHMIIYTSDS